MTSNTFRERSPSGYSTPIDLKNRAAALGGASHAFSKGPKPTKPLLNTYTGSNGALAAASSAGLGSRREKRHQPTAAYLNKPHADDCSINGSQTAEPMQMRGSVRQTSQSRELSPSHVAAQLATSRATPSRTVSSSSHISRQQFPLPTTDLTSSNSMGQAIPVTTSLPSLVNLFESEQHQKVPTTHSVRYVSKTTWPAANSTAPIPLKRSSSSASTALRSIPAAQRLESGDKTSENSSVVGAATVATKSARPREPPNNAMISLRPANRSVPEPPPPPPLQVRRGTDGPLDTPTDHHKDLTESFLNEVAADLRSNRGKSPTRPALPERRTEPANVPLARPSKKVSRPSLPTYQTADKTTSDPVRLGRNPIRVSDNYIPKLTVDSLANAMVASSLASSRAPSPSKPPPLPPPRRHGKHSLFHHHSNHEPSRTPSPAKGMRQTMRDPQKSSDEDEARKPRNHRVRKHPNKHHEGDRKRYRNEVTERERKRYEGVWAANKGILDDTLSSTAVVNIVVRNIWKRSRLPDDVLAEVWDLVDIQGVGKLEREEFVVGMFLIDQRLKGNKLPSKVSESIWSSVRRLSGINIPRNRR